MVLLDSRNACRQLHTAGLSKSSTASSNLARNYCSTMPSPDLTAFSSRCWSKFGEKVAVKSWSCQYWLKAGAWAIRSPMNYDGKTGWQDATVSSTNKRLITYAVYCILYRSFARGFVRRPHTHIRVTLQAIRSWTRSCCCRRRHANAFARHGCMSLKHVTRPSEEQHRLAVSKGLVDRVQSPNPAFGCEALQSAVTR